MPDDFPFEELTNALVSAFPDYDTLNLMTTFKLGTPLANIAPPGPQPVVVLKLITWAKSRGRVDDLIVGAQNQTPENPELIAVAEQFSLDEGAGEFERIVKPHIAFADVDQWRADMMRCERAVCRIEFGEEGIGTGFLVGTDVVVTNYHVMQDVVDGAVRPEDVGARFDYKMKPGGKTAQKGKSYKLAKSDWLIAGSPPKELDYALIRLKRQSGKRCRGAVRPEPRLPQTGECFAPGRRSAVHHSASEGDSAQICARLCRESRRRDEPNLLLGEHRGRLLGLAVLHQRLEPRRAAPLG